MKCLFFYLWKTKQNFYHQYTTKKIILQNSKISQRSDERLKTIKLQEIVDIIGDFFYMIHENKFTYLLSGSFKASEERLIIEIIPFLTQ